MLKQQLHDELYKAMKAKDTAKVSTITMLNSSIGYFEIEQGKDYEASDEDVLKLTAKEAKKRKDAIVLYKQGNRADLVEKETHKLKILESYLPAQMSEADVRKVVSETIKQVGATSASDMGKVMGPVMGKLKGKADGSLVNKIVKEELS